MHICTYENIHICVYAHMNRRAYDNGSGRVLEHLFGAQPVAQNRTPVLNAMAAGLRKGQPQTSRPTQKSQLFGFRLLTLAFCCRWVGTYRPTCWHSQAPLMVPQLWRPASKRYSVRRFNSVVLSYFLPHFLN